MAETEFTMTPPSDAPFRRKLSILIPTLVGRRNLLTRLFSQIKEQNGDYWADDESVGDGSLINIFTFKDVHVLVYKDDGRRSIGYKRNKLLEMSFSDYIVFIDDDDRIGDNYFNHAFTGIEKGVDVCGLTGIITEDGKNPKKFVHSMRYDSWFEKDSVYYRNNNHLNVIKRDIAIKMKFPEINNGEDHDYSKQLQKSGLIKTEYWDENEIIYYYDYRSKK